MRLVDMDNVPTFKALCETGAFRTDIAHELLAQLIDEIHLAPTVEAAPVVHGHWIWQEEQHGTPIDGYDYGYGWICSECKHYADEYTGTVEYDDPDKKPPFPCCPNCGAKMDL